MVNATTFDNWKTFINSMLLDGGKFTRLSTGKKEQADIEVFVLKDNRDEYHTTRIEAGYLDDRLFYLNINNPKIPGYIKFQEGEYFHQHDFTEGKSKGMPGLEFNEANSQAILCEFKKGLQGKEVQYLRHGKVVKVELYPVPEMPDMSYVYDFEKARVFDKFRNILNKSGGDLEIREINLNDIFSGI